MNEPKKSKRGFALLSPEQRSWMRAKAGNPSLLRSAASLANPGLPAEAGKKGGQKNVPAEKHSFSNDPKLAEEPGRKGGITSRTAQREKKSERSD